MLLCSIIFLTLVPAFSKPPKQFLKPPPFWSDPECNEPSAFLEVGPKPRKYGLFGDELDPKSINHLSKASRRVWYGVENKIYDYPSSSICNIKGFYGDFQWCSCIILSARFVLTKRLCFWYRVHETPPTDKLPHILVQYGSNFERQQHNTSEVTAIYHHPNPAIDAALLRLKKQIRFTNTLKPLGPKTWLKTTGWRNLIPKCSTLMCGFGQGQKGPTRELRCIFYGLTTNIGTMFATGLNFDGVYLNNTRAWLGSVNALPSVYEKYVTGDEVGDAYSSYCWGDGGAPLLFWDRKGTGDIYLIGMITDNRNKKECGKFGVDIAVSMIALVGWLAEYIDDVPNPFLTNQHDE